LLLAAEFELVINLKPAKAFGVGAEPGRRSNPVMLRRMTAWSMYTYKTDFDPARLTKSLT